MKICVVDDEDLLVKGHPIQSENEGYEVVTGSNGLKPWTWPGTKSRT